MDRDDAKSWVEEETLDGHSDWVRDIAYAPNIGLPKSYLASCSQVQQRIITCLFCVDIDGTLTCVIAI